MMPTGKIKQCRAGARLEALTSAAIGRPDWIALPAVMFTLALLLPAPMASAQEDLDFLFEDSPSSGQSGSQGADTSGTPEQGASQADSAAPAQSASEPPPQAADEPGSTPQAPAADQTADEGPTTAARSSRSRLVEEIIVTARRREEKLADVPISIQAFSGNQLDALGIGELDEFQEQVPTLNVGKSASFSTVYLRGIGTDAFLSSDPSVAYYVDGIYFPFSLGLSQPFGKVERIEVLKGPQGTTFGRNAIGGAIHVITEDPRLDEFSGEIKLGYGEFADINARGYATGPLTETIAISATAEYGEREVYGDQILGGEPVNDGLESQAGRVQLRWKPTDWLDTNVTYFRVRRTGPAERANGNEDPSPLCESIGCTPQRGHDFELSIPIDFELNNEVISTTITGNTPWFDTKLRGSHQDILVEPDFDFDGTPAPGPVFEPVQFGDINTAELQFLSSKGTPFSDWLSFVFGIYGYDGTIGFDPLTVAAVSTFDVNNFFGDPDNTAGNEGSPQQTIIDFLGNLGAPIPTGTVQQVSGVSTEAYSFYGQFTIDFTDWVALTLGGRFNRELRELDEARTFAMNADGSEGQEIFNSSDQAADEDGNIREPEETTRSFDPKISLDFHPFRGGFGPFSDNTIVYASYQEATAAATFNPLPLVQPSAFVEATDLKAFEIGFKGTLFNTITLTAAVFQYDIEDLQTQFVALAGNGVVGLQNISAESRGFDFDMTAQVFPNLIDGLVFKVGGGYIDSELMDAEEVGGFDPETGVFRDDINANGGQIPYSPEVSYNAAIIKTWNFLPGGPLETGVNVYHTDSYFLTSDNNPNFQEDGYTLLGARISYLYEPWNLRGTLNGDNLTDELYVDGCICNDYGFVNHNGAPRRVSFTLTKKFE